MEEDELDQAIAALQMPSAKAWTAHASTMSAQRALAEPSSSSSSPIAKFKVAVRAFAAIRELSQPIREREGSDTMLFRNVPAWIQFRLIPKFRYRLVRALDDAACPAELHTRRLAQTHMHSAAPLCV